MIHKMEPIEYHYRSRSCERRLEAEPNKGKRTNPGLEFMPAT